MSVFLADFYLLRNTYHKITDFNKESIINQIDLTYIDWKTDIYISNIKKLVRLKKFSNGILYELEYRSYRLFFLLVVDTDNQLTKVFWVNILKLGTIYEKYKNEKIIDYKLGMHDYNNVIVLNDQTFTVAYTGNSLINFCRKNNYSFTNLGESVYLVELLFKGSMMDYLYGKYEDYGVDLNDYEGKPIDYEFNSFVFKDFIIVY